MKTMKNMIGEKIINGESISVVIDDDYYDLRDQIEEIMDLILATEGGFNLWKKNPELVLESWGYQFGEELRKEVIDFIEEFELDFEFDGGSTVIRLY